MNKRHKETKEESRIVQKVREEDVAQDERGNANSSTVTLPTTESFSLLFLN
jgi:hypothetical protein